jgi:hypothetical protein
MLTIFCILKGNDRNVLCISKQLDCNVYVGLLDNFLSDTEYKVSAQELIECSTTGMYKNNGVTGGFAENVNYLLIWL